VKEVERVLSHDDAEVLLGLGDKAIGESALRTAQRGLLRANQGGSHRLAIRPVAVRRL